MRTANTYPKRSLCWLSSSPHPVRGRFLVDFGEQLCAVRACFWNSILHTPLRLRSCLFWVHQLCSVLCQHHQLFTLHLPALGFLADQRLKMSCFDFLSDTFSVTVGPCSLGSPIGMNILHLQLGMMFILNFCLISTFVFFKKNCTSS